MTGFELRICGVGNKHSNNCATISGTKKNQKFVKDSVNRQMSIKVPKNDFTRKIIDFDTFTKNA